jgi:hypothetical protein
MNLHWMHKSGGIDSKFVRNVLPNFANPAAAGQQKPPGFGKLLKCVTTVVKRKSALFQSERDGRINLSLDRVGRHTDCFRRDSPADEACRGSGVQRYSQSEERTCPAYLPSAFSSSTSRSKASMWPLQRFCSTRRRYLHSGETSSLVKDFS